MVTSFIIAGILGILGGIVFRFRRRRASQIIALGSPDGHRYRVLVGSVDWFGDDSAHASQVIAKAQAKGIAWQLYMDGVLKKQG